MSVGSQPILTSAQHDSQRYTVPGTNAKVLGVPQDLECHSEQLSALWVPRVGKEPGLALMGGCCTQGTGLRMCEVPRSKGVWEL